MDEVRALWTTVAGPWGPFHVAATDRGVVAIDWLTTATSFERRLAGRLGGSISPARTGKIDSRMAVLLDAAVAALEAFLDGRDPPDPLRLDLADRPEWDRRVLTAVSSIPRGRTASYGEIARRIGAPRAARAVGGAVGRNPIGLLIPCHRVIAADGGLGGYGGDAWGSREERLAIKRELLRREGVEISVGPIEGRSVGHPTA